MIGYILVILLAVVAYAVFSSRFTGWRTKIAATFTAVVGGLLPLLGDLLAPALPYASDIATYLKDLDWREYVGADNAPWIVLGTGILFFILRRMTTGPVGVR